LTDTLHLVRKLAARDDLNDVEQSLLSRLIAKQVTYAAGEVIVPEGVRQTHSQLLLSGLAARSTQMADGRRQITELHVPGDFVDLHSFLLKRLEHDVIALTPVRTGWAPHERVAALTEEAPHLTRMLWLSTLIDAAIHREWIVSAGRRSALQQIGCLFCEVWTRFDVVGLAEGDRCPLPLTQIQLADVCGLTAVHVNRVLRDLRGEGLVIWARGELILPDRARLAARVGFDPGYLALEREPR
jgi:CRP-like cAMP-binding protein